MKAVFSADKAEKGAAPRVESRRLSVPCAESELLAVPCAGDAPLAPRAQFRNGSTKNEESPGDFFTRQIAFLPERLQSALQKIQNVWEIRLRKNCPVTVFFGEKSQKNGSGYQFLTQKKAYLGENGVTDKAGLAVITTADDVASCLLNLSGNAVYRISDDLRRGALYGFGGVRIGVAGRAVTENGKVLSIAEVTSLCVRIPMTFFGNAAQLEPFLKENGRWYSTLIFSPPAGGKTTLLRDFCWVVSEKEQAETVLIDERGELSAGQTFRHADVIAQMPKREALSVAIRSLHPDVILTDEIVGDADAKAVLSAMRAGATVFCSVHGDTLAAVLAAYPELREMQRFIGLVQEKGLRYAVVYKNNNDVAPQRILLSAGAD